MSDLLRFSNKEIHSNLVVIFQLKREEDTQSIKKVASQLPTSHILALVNCSIDNFGVANIVRSGACQVVMLPFSIRDFRESVTRISIQFGHNVVSSKAISICGCHGGVGSTCLSFNLAYEIALKWEKETILIESPGSDGTIATFLNLDCKTTVDDLTQLGEDLDVYSVRDALVPYSKHLSILGGSKHVEEIQLVPHRAVEKILNSARQLAEVVIIDLQTAKPEIKKVLLDASDKHVLVGEHTIPSISILRDKLTGIYADLSPLIVINKFDRADSELGKESIMQFLESNSIFIIANDHSAFSRAINSGSPLRFASKRSVALDDIQALAHQVLDQPFQQQEVHTGIFESLNKMMRWRQPQVSTGR